MAEIVLSGVTKRYGDATVVDSFDLTVRDGELMVLVGPSGCGKSTVLRMIAGLEEISDGTISIDGRVVNELPPKDRDIAMVFQTYALYPHMSVRENLEYGLKMRKVAKEERARLVEEAAEILGLEELLGRKPKDLSGGQRQRVAVGRAIVRHPRAFLFDEPLSNLDAKFRMQMRAEIARIQKRLATTALYVTHDQVEAMTMGSRIAVMRDGFLQQVGTPLDVYRRPANLFVAGFVGSPPMNFLPVHVSEDGASLRGDGFTLPVPADLRGALRSRPGAEMIAGVRPEHVAEASALPESAVPLPAEVTLAEPLGSEVVIHATRQGNQTLIARLGADRIDRVPDIGSRIELAIDPEAVHLFDAATENRIEEHREAA